MNQRVRWVQRDQHLPWVQFHRSRPWHQADHQHPDVGVQETEQFIASCFTLTQVCWNTRTDSYRRSSKASRSSRSSLSTLTLLKHREKRKTVSHHILDMRQSAADMKTKNILTVRCSKELTGEPRGPVGPATPTGPASP